MSAGGISTPSSACPSTSPLSNSDTSFTSDVVSPAIERPPFAKDLPLALRRAHRINAGLRKEPYILVDDKFETSLSKSKDLKLILKRKLDTSHSNKLEKKKHVGDREDYVPSSKKKRKIPKKLRDQDNSNDFYCWICHREGSVICCELCPRVYHSRCLQLKEEPDGDWFCPECQKIMKAECVESQSRAMAMLSVDQLSRLLIFSLQRMKHTWAQPFMKPVDAEAIPDYYEYIFHPMDLATLEKNIKSKKYGSTDAFLTDAKWILHNCIIYNGSNHKLTNNAKMIIKICKHEMSEIEVCEDCYLSSCIKRDNWFCEPCKEPHSLVWARLQGFPFWPAKALQTKKGQVDVRFFGQHDRAWVPVPNCYKISEEIPHNATKKKTNGLNSAITEMGLHIEKICKKFGKFDYAPHRTPYDPKNTKLKKYNSLVAGKSSSKSKIISNNSIYGKSPILSIKKEPLEESDKLIIVDDEVSLKIPTNIDYKDTRRSKETKKSNNDRKSYGTEKPNDTGNSKDSGKTNDKKKQNDTRNSNDNDKLNDKSSKNSGKTKDTGKVNDTMTSDNTLDSKKTDNSKDTEKANTVKQSDAGKPNDTENSGDSKDIEKTNDSEKANSTMKEDADIGSSNDKSILEKIADFITDQVKEKEPEETTKTSIDKQGTDKDEEKEELSNSKGKQEQSAIPKIDENNASVSKQSTDIASAEVDIDVLTIDEEKEVTEDKTEEPSHKITDMVIDKEEVTKNLEKEIEESKNVDQIKTDQDGMKENTNENKIEMDASTEKKQNDEGDEMEDSSQEKTNKEEMEDSNKEKMDKGEKNSPNGTPKRNTFMEKLGKTIESCKAILGFVEDKEVEMQSESESEESESDSDSSDDDIEEIGYEVRRERSCSSEEAMDVDDDPSESGKISPTDEDGFENDDKSCSSGESKNEKSGKEFDTLEAGDDKSSSSGESKNEKSGKEFDKLETGDEKDDDCVFEVEDNTKVKPANSADATQPTEPIKNGMDAVVTMSVENSEVRSVENSEVRSVENSEVSPKPDIADTKQSDDVTDSNKDDGKKEVDEKESENHQEKSSKEKSNEIPEHLNIELNESKQDENLENDQVFDHMKEIVDLVHQQTPGNKFQHDSESFTTPDSNRKVALAKVIADDAGNQPQTSKDEKNSVKFGQIAARIKNFDKYIGKVSDVVKETLIEMYSEVAEESVEDETKKVMRGFQEEVDFLKWRHTRELEEFKHVAALTIAEMRSTFDHDKSKALEVLRKQMTAEKQTAIELAKKKQWCANCIKEAVFYCCWNTSYCDYPCQQRHWPTHMKTCQQLGSTENAADKSPKPVVSIQSSIMKPHHPHISDPMLQSNQQLARPHPVQIIPAASTNQNNLQTLIQYVQAPQGATLQTNPIQANNPRLPAPNPGGLYRLEPVHQFPVLRPQNILRNMVGPQGQPVILRPNMLHIPNVNQRL